MKHYKYSAGQWKEIPKSINFAEGLDYELLHAGYEVTEVETKFNGFPICVYTKPYEDTVVFVLQFPGLDVALWMEDPFSVFQLWKELSVFLREEEPSFPPSEETEETEL